MNKTKKTYGIKGFMEYQAVIKVGKSRMKVPFTDGALTGMGVVPCTFTTERFMVQHAIENCDEFKRGLIYIVNSIPLDGKVDIERPSSGPAAPLAEANADMTPAIQREEQTATGQEAAEEGVAENPVEAVWPAKSAEPDSPMTQVEFASNDEAKDYLEQNFGLVRSKLRNREDIFTAGKANGVEIIFI